MEPREILDIIGELTFISNQTESTTIKDRLAKVALAAIALLEQRITEDKENTSLPKS